MTVKIGLDGNFFSSIGAHAIPVPDARFPEFVLVHDWWQELRASRWAPARAEIDPASLKSVLPRLTLVDVHRGTAAPHPTFSFRLAGTDMRTLHNMEIQHRGIDEMRPEAYRRLLNVHYREVVETRAPTAYEIRFRRADGVARAYASLRVPLSDDGDEVTQILTIDNFCERWNDLRATFDALYGRGAGQ